MSKISAYIRESADEIRKVKWPTRQTTIQYSLIVLLSVIGFTALFGTLDFVLQLGIDKLLIQ